MALIWAESCDDVSTHGWTLGGIAPVAITDRYSTSKAWQASSGASTNFTVARAVTAADQDATMTFGMAFTGKGGGGTGLVALLVIHDTTGAARATVWLNKTSTSGNEPYIIEVRRGAGSGGTLLATTTVEVVDSAAWYYIEVQYVTALSTGSVEVRVNEVVKASASSIDTTGGLAGTLLGGCLLNMPGVAFSAPNWAVDDLYITKGGGYLGDVRVARLRPNADGINSEWLGSDGDSTNNYQQVDNVAISGAIWNESSTDEATDYYNVDNTPAASAGEEVFGVLFKSSLWCDALNRGASELVKTAAETERAEVALTTTVGTLFFHVDETQPGGGAWTTADLDTMQVGVRVKS